MLDAFILLSSLSIIKLIAGDSLADAIAQDLLQDTSSSCTGLAPDKTTFIDTFFPSNSDWQAVNADFEADVFMIEMQHEDTDPDRSWQLRVGKGGQMVSFRGAFGESVSNQGVVGAVWNDLVQQLVAVSSTNDGANWYERKFIHGSGPYTNDTEIEIGDTPFYNPNLALSCNDNQCISVNWGQQAHVPHQWESKMLFYQRFRNCGNGVVEYDQAIHYFGDESAETYTYFNTPWTGVRTSTFRDVLYAQDGGLEHVYPLVNWGLSAAAGNHIFSLRDTDGYTVFAEHSKISPELETYVSDLCVSSGVVVECSSQAEAEPLALEVQVDGSAIRIEGHEAPHGLDIVLRANLCSLSSSVGDSTDFWPREMRFINGNNEDISIKVSRIIHWCWQGLYTFFGTSFNEGDSTYDADIFNAYFKAGDPIVMKDIGKPDDEQYALSFVHGTNYEGDPAAGNPWINANSRVRWGYTSRTRDGTVFTTNFLGGSMAGTQTYYNRKYMVVGKYSGISADSSPWVDEAFEDLLSLPEISTKGRAIRLYYSGTAFGAAVGTDSVECAGTLACEGSSTPRTNAKPLFYITCENTVYIGSDPYNFAPDDDPLVYYDTDLGETIEKVRMQPWRCAGSVAGTRPNWKLLGFFEEGSCSALGSRTYDENYSFKCKMSGMYGDPHIMKWNGDKYNFHGECDLVLLNAPDFSNGLGVDVHVRTTIQNWFSYIEGVAIKVGDVVANVNRDGFWVDRVLLSDFPATEGVFTVRRYVETNVTQYHVFVHGNKVVSLRVPQLASMFMFVTMVTPDLIDGHDRHFNTSVGLMGEYTTGRTLGRDGVTEILDMIEFGKEWQVQPYEEMLFLDVRGPQLPNGVCKMPTPLSIATRQLRASNVKFEKQAKKACAGVGAAFFSDCVEDVVSTEDFGVVSAYM